MTTQFAEQIYQHLKDKNISFCFTTYGLITREYLTESFGYKF